MAADLAHDRGHREGHEVGAGVDVEAHHRVDQPDAGHLDEVVARFAAALEAARDVVGQRQAALDDLVPLALNFHGVGRHGSQLPEHVRNIGVFVRTRDRTAGSSRCHLLEAARRAVSVMPKTLPVSLGSRPS